MLLGDAFVKKLFLITALLAFGTPVHATSESNKKKCEALALSLYYMVLAGAPLEILHEEVVMVVNSSQLLFDYSDERRVKNLRNNMLKAIYYDIGRLKERTGKGPNYDEAMRVQNKLCKGVYALAWQ